MSEQSPRTARRSLHGLGRRASVVVLTTALLVFAGSTGANAADPDPVGDLVKGVTDTVKDVTKPITQGSSAGKPSTDAGGTTSDDDSPGHETDNPTAPDHGSSHVNHTDVAGGSLVTDASSSDSRVNDDDSTEADATLLAVNGMQIAGSKASSDGETEGHGPVPTLPVCDSTDGALCLDALYADSSATDSGTTSRSAASTGIASLCLGGSSTTTCNGALDVGAGQSSSSAHRNQTTGRTTTESSSSAAGVCLARDAITGLCTLQLGLLSADGSTDSDGSTQRSSSVATIGGSGIGTLPLPGLPTIPTVPGSPLPTLPTDPTQPFAITIPDDDCPAATSLLCIFGNQGESYGSTGLLADSALAKGTAQTALDVTALGGVISTDLAHAETLAHNDGGTPTVDPPSTNPPGSTGTTGTPSTTTKASAVSGILPNTGGVWSGLIGLGLLLFALGAVATAWDRRRMTA